MIVPRFLAVLVTLAVLGPVADAQAQVPAAVDDGRAVRLEEAVKLALERNLDLTIDRLNPLIGREQIREAKGGFDPVLSSGVTFTRTERFLTSILEVEAESGIVVDEILNIDYGTLTGRLPTGTQYSLGLSTPITETNHPLRLYDESYQAALTFGLVQPLLRDFGLEVNTVRIRQAKTSTAAARYGVEARMLTIIRDVEAAYWNVFFTSQHLVVTNESLALADDLVARLLRMRDAGLATDIEVAQAQATAEGRRAAVMRAGADHRSAQAQLRLLIDPRLEMTTGLLVADAPAEAVLPTDLAGKRARALALRPELRQQELLIHRMAMDEHLAMNATQWRLDFLTGAGYSGLAGTGVNPNLRRELPARLQGRDAYTDAFRDFFTGDGNLSWWVGGRLQIPLGNNEAQARLKQVRLRRKQEELRLAQLRSRVSVEVEAAFDDMTAEVSRLRAAHQEVAVARGVLANRERELTAGLATSRQLLEAQEAAARAMDAQNLAWAAYAAARARLAAAHVQSFDDYRLVLER